MKAIYTIRFNKLGVFIFNNINIVMVGFLRQFIVYLYFILFWLVLDFNNIIIIIVSGFK